MRKQPFIIRIALAVVLLSCLFFTSCGDDSAMDETKPDIPLSAASHFSWDMTIALEESNDWSLMIQTNSIAITNLTEKKQYRLLWQGDLSAGKKADPVLRIVEKGKQSEIISLQQLEVSAIKDGRYSITFGNEDREGELLFTK